MPKTILWEAFWSPAARSAAAPPCARQAQGSWWSSCTGTLGELKWVCLRGRRRLGFDYASLESVPYPAHCMAEQMLVWYKHGAHLGLGTCGRVGWQRMLLPAAESAFGALSVPGRDDCILVQSETATEPKHLNGSWQCHLFVLGWFF